MEVKIKSMKYEDFKDNEYIEHLVDELKASHTNVCLLYTSDAADEL